MQSTQEATRQKLASQLTLFDNLPDSAFVDLKVVSALLARSNASIWRDVAQGRLAKPLRAGLRSTRWRVGDVRLALMGRARHG